MLSVMEQETIVDEYVNKYVPQKEIALRHRVTVQLVRDLVSESKKMPEKLRDAKAREKLEDDQRAAIKEAVGNFTREGKAISSAKLVRDQVQEDAGLDVSTKLVRQVLKADCQLSFVRAKKLNPQANSDRSLVLR